MAFKNPSKPGSMSYQLIEVLRRAKQPIGITELAEGIGTDVNVSGHMLSVEKVLTHNGIPIYSYIDPERGVNGQKRRLFALDEFELEPWVTGQTRKYTERGPRREVIAQTNGQGHTVGGHPASQPLIGSGARILGLMFDEETREIRTIVKSDDKTWRGITRKGRPQIGAAGVVVAIGLHAGGVFMDIATDARQITVEDIVEV